MHSFLDVHTFNMRYIISCVYIPYLVAICILFNFLFYDDLALATLSMYTPTSLLILISVSDKGVSDMTRALTRMRSATWFYLLNLTGSI